jgi:hypothetical protein
MTRILAASCRLVAYALLLSATIIRTAPAQAPQAAETSDLAKIVAELNRLADRCSTLGLSAEEAITRQWLPAQRADQQTFYLPVEPIRVSDRAESTAWLRHFSRAREFYAEHLFELAKQLADSGDETGAYRLLWQVLRENPAHPQALEVLGPLASAVSTKPRPRGNADRPELAEVGSFQRWQSRNFDLFSRMETKTTLALSKSIEQFYCIWTQCFYELWAPPGLLKARLNGEKRSWPDSNRMAVVMLADRAEYLKALGMGETNISLSTGYYHPQSGCSYFYWDDGALDTVNHELTHQLFAEASRIGNAGYFDRSSIASDRNSDRSTDRSTVRSLDRVAGAWVIEGVALYMESIRDQGFAWTLGGIESNRLQTARYRAVRDQYWPEWESFTQQSIAQWKEDPRIALAYSHATGLTHLFLDLHPEKSRARAALFRYLTGVYGGQSNADDLLRLLGEDEASAERNFRSWMTVSQPQLEAVRVQNPQIEQLVLAGSQLTDWRALREFDSLRWLDLSFTNVNSQDLDWLPELQPLERLSLEGTQIDSQVLPWIAALPNLVELDLSGCKIDDDSLRVLKDHPKLETLWLTRTAVTNQVLETLASMAKLRQCDLSQTLVTEEAWQDFLKSKPTVSAP